MHQSGIHMKNEVIRGEELIHTATSEVYDFEQQGAYHHPQGEFCFVFILGAHTIHDVVANFMPCSNFISKIRMRFCLEIVLG